MIVILSSSDHRVSTLEMSFDSSHSRESILHDFRGSDQSLNFEGFDWTPESSTPKHRVKRESHPGLQTYPRRTVSVEDNSFSLDRKAVRKVRRQDEVDNSLLAATSPRHGAEARMGQVPTRYYMYMCIIHTYIRAM